MDNKLITLNNKHCQFLTIDKPIFNSLKTFLSYKEVGIEYSPAFQHGGWNGMNYLINKDGVFNSGLLTKVREHLISRGVSFVEEDHRKPLIANQPLDISAKLVEMGMVPRDYQERIVEAACNSDKGIVRSATGSGKCTDKYSLHITEYGMLDYTELQEMTNQNQMNPGDIASLVMNLATPLTENKLDKSSLLYYDGYGPAKKIITEYGFTLTGTPDHKIQILNEQGNIIWKPLKDLTVNDYSVISFNTQLFGKEEIPLDEAYWYGLLIGDGGMTGKSQTKLTNMDSHILDFATSYLNSKKIKYKLVSGKSKATDVVINNSEYRRKLFDYGFGYHKSIHKTLPPKIRMLKKEPLAMLIRGIYETDGWIENDHNRPCVCLALSNKKLIDQIHLILLNYGIVSSRRLKKTTHEDSHQLTIYKEFIPVFMREIGLDSNGHKFKKINEALKDCADINLCNNANTNLVPNQQSKIEILINEYFRLYSRKSLYQESPIKFGTLRSWYQWWRRPSKEKLLAFVNWYKNKLIKDGNLSTNIETVINDLCYICNSDYYYLPITNIEDTLSDNYDFVVPETHSFVSQGFINHNTACTALITARFNKPTIIYVIGLDLLKQFHDLYSELFDEKIGYIGNGVCDIQRINIATIWTIGRSLNLKNVLADNEDESQEKDIDDTSAAKIMKMLTATKLHIFDESHVVATSTIKQIYKHIDPENIYGFSGTPFREDISNLVIHGFLGEKIVDVSASELIARGILAQPIIKFIAVPGRRFASEDTYPTIYKEYIVENDQRNNLILEATKTLVNKNYTPLVLFKQIKHGKILLKLFQDADIKCEMLYGDDSLERRTEVKRMLIDKEINLVLASTIFDMGIDLPLLNALILCGSGKSYIRSCQRIGRVIRKFPGKTIAAVIDFYDQVRHLKHHSIIRCETYESEIGFKVVKCKEMLKH